MATTAEASNNNDSPLPPFTVLTRVASIPLVSDSLNTLHSTLSSSPWTSAPYSTAQNLTHRAYNASLPLLTNTPVQNTLVNPVLVPVLSKADQFANKAVDEMQRRNPYLFSVHSDEMIGDVRSASGRAVGVARERVVDPAVGVVEGIDRKFAPVVDRFESVVNSLHSHNGNGSSSSTDPTSVNTPEPYPAQSSSDSAPNGSTSTSTDNAGNEYQYQRAYRLSLDLTHQLASVAGEQVRSVQRVQEYGFGVVVDRALQTTTLLSNLVHSSYTTTSQTILSLSDTMLRELQSLQATITASISHLPTHIQASLSALSANLTDAIYEISNILRSDVSVGEKASKVGACVVARVRPVVEGVGNSFRGGVSSVNGANANGVNGVGSEQKAKVE